ncbi:MAG: ATP-binding cassette domain-containing protein, partial [Clostridiaceae bacterium]
MELLKTNYLTKTYGNGEAAVKALKYVDLIIERGEFTAIVRLRGSGKSTLLHLLAGLDKPSGGHVCINGSDIYAMSEKELSRFRRRNIGFIFKFFNLIPNLQVAACADRIITISDGEITE